MIYSNFISKYQYNNDEYKKILYAGNDKLLKKINLRTICDHNRLLYKLIELNNVLDKENVSLLKIIICDSKYTVTKLIQYKRSNSTINSFPEILYSIKNKTIINPKYEKDLIHNENIVDTLFNENKYIYGIYKSLYDNVNDNFIKKIIKIITFLRYRIDIRMDDIEKQTNYNFNKIYNKFDIKY